MPFSKSSGFSVIFLDLDDFKQINDTLVILKERVFADYRFEIIHNTLLRIVRPSER
jgi:GGDEF domain-containing protein